MNIFIIDGSKVGSTSLANAFANQAEFQITGFAETSTGVLDALRRSAPDVVILDIELPGKSGIELLRELKRELPALPVIVFTRVSGINYREKCREAGAEYFFDKFRDVEQVTLTLKALMLRSTRISDSHQ